MVIERVGRTYTEAGKGEAIALIDSSDCLEIAVIWDGPVTIWALTQKLFSGLKLRWVRPEVSGQISEKVEGVIVNPNVA